MSQIQKEYLLGGLFAGGPFLLLTILTIVVSRNSWRIEYNIEEDAKFCPRCGNKVYSGAGFCTRCRLPLNTTATTIKIPDEVAFEVELKFCPKCGNRVYPGAAFCSKCGQPLPSRAKAKEVPKVSGESREPAKPITQPFEASNRPERASETKRTEIMPLSLSSLDLLLIGLGTVVILIGFFLGWFHVSSPVANVIFGGLVSLDLSGMNIFTGFPEFGLPGSVAVAVIPLLALFALAVYIPTIRSTKIGNYVHVVHIGIGILGIAFMLFMLLGTQALYENAFRRIGLPSTLGQKIISFDPAIGFWFTLLGFALVIGGGMWNRQRRR